MAGPATGRAGVSLRRERLKKHGRTPELGLSGKVVDRTGILAFRACATAKSGKRKVGTPDPRNGNKCPQRVLSGKNAAACPFFPTASGRRRQSPKRRCAPSIPHASSVEVREAIVPFSRQEDGTSCPACGRLPIKSSAPRRAALCRQNVGKSSAVARRTRKGSLPTSGREAIRKNSKEAFMLFRGYTGFRPSPKRTSVKKTGAPGAKKFNAKAPTAHAGEKSAAAASGVCPSFSTHQKVPLPLRPSLVPAISSRPIKITTIYFNKI